MLEGIKVEVIDKHFWAEEVVRLYREGHTVKEAICIVKEEKERWNKDGKGKRMDP